MIEVLRKIHGNLERNPNLTWDDVNKSFYGQNYAPACIMADLDFGALVGCESQDIIDGIESDGKMKHYSISLETEEWREDLGFFHKEIDFRYPYIRGVNPIAAHFLPKEVTKELDPSIEDFLERIDRITARKATNCPYTHLLSMEAGDRNPKPLFVDALGGIVSLLENLERQNKPYWFYFNILGHPQGIRFP